MRPFSQSTTADKGHLWVGISLHKCHSTYTHSYYANIKLRMQFLGKFDMQENTRVESPDLFVLYFLLLSERATSFPMYVLFILKMIKTVALFISLGKYRRKEVIVGFPYQIMLGKLSNTMSERPTLGNGRGCSE